MTIDSYQQAAASLGIERGKLAVGFADEREKRVDEAESVPPITEIPERLRSKARRQTVDDHRAKLRRVPEPYRSLYSSMLDRGTSIEDIARHLGLCRTPIDKALHGHGGKNTTAEVAGLLTARERKLLRWDKLGRKMK